MLPFQYCLLATFYLNISPSFNSSSLSSDIRMVYISEEHRTLYCLNPPCFLTVLWSKE